MSSGGSSAPGGPESPSQQKEKQNDPTRGVLSPDTEDEMDVEGFQLVTWKLAICWICIVLTGGLLALVLYWMPRWKVLLTHRRMSLAKADTVVIRVSYFIRCRSDTIALVQGVKNLPLTQGISG